MNDFVNKIIQGDCLSVLKTLPDNNMDCIITSPPYWGLRNYGAEGQIGLEPTFKEYLDRMMLIFAELKRVLKPTGSLWLNMGDAYGTYSGGMDQLTKQDNTHYGQIKYSKEGWGVTQIKDKGVPEKSLIGQPWRMALRMIDEQGWILRSDIKWIKQILIYKERRTIGSVMPTSVKDRFNSAGEYLFHFVKNKKYYFNLDAVRIKPQTFENRPSGIDREKDYPNAKRNNFAFNYRVRDAVKKEGQPQFRASKEEIKKYKKDNGLPANYLAPTGTDHNALNNPNGKNIPNSFLIDEEVVDFPPFSIQEQVTILGVKEFENLSAITLAVINKLKDFSATMLSRFNASANEGGELAGNRLQKFLGAAPMQPNFSVFGGSPYATITIKNSANKISVIFGRNKWVFRREGFTGSNSTPNEIEGEVFIVKCDAEMQLARQVFSLVNWVGGIKFGLDELNQLNVIRTKLNSITSSPKSALDIAITDEKSEEICLARTNAAKVFMVESIFSIILHCGRVLMSLPTMIVHTAPTTAGYPPSAPLNIANIPHIFSLSDFRSRGNTIPNAWLIGTEPQKDAHFAMFPTALCEIPILSSCPEDGLVFDPFMGGGSTAVCAKRLKRNYLGIELNPDYIKIAQKRIDNTLTPMF